MTNLLSENSRILITGSSGMLGMAMLRFLLEKGKGNFDLWVDSYNVSAMFDLNYLSRSELVQCPIPEEISHLIHLAGVPGQVQADLLARQWQVYEENAIYSFRLVENFFRHRIERNVFIGSTGAVYGDDEICDDSRAISLSIERPNNSYGNSKLFSELAFHLASFDKHRVIVGRIFHTFSPWFKDTDPRALQDILLSAVKENKIVIKTPQFTRSYLHYSDFCEAVRCVFDAAHSYGCVNIGSENNIYTLGDLANLVRQRFEFICGKSCSIHINQNALTKNETLYKRPLLERLKSLKWQEKEHISAAIDIFFNNWKKEK